MLQDRERIGPMRRSNESDLESDAQAQVLLTGSQSDESNEKKNEKVQCEGLNRLAAAAMR